MLDKGEIVEFERPSTLMQQPGSAFRELCARSEEFDVLFEMALEADRERARTKEARRGS